MFFELSLITMSQTFIQTLDSKQEVLPGQCRRRTSFAASRCHDIAAANASAKGILGKNNRYLEYARFENTKLLYLNKRHQNEGLYP